MGNKLKTAASGRTRQRVGRLHRLRALLAIGLLGSQAWSAGAQTMDADIAAGARFAAEHCGACHGATGQSVAPNFPRLAGQNETYLVKQLKDFASGDRKSPLMKEKVAMMDDRMIRSLAAHYASQKAANTPSDDAQLMAVGQFVYERGNCPPASPATTPMAVAAPTCRAWPVSILATSKPSCFISTSAHAATTTRS
jgi:cytochrome c553